LYSIQHISPQLVLGFLDLKAFSEANALLEKREIEKKGALYLASQMLKKPDICISFDNHGKPFLNEYNCRISISHSHQWLLLAIHQTEEVGVDIELVKEKIKGIASRFLNEEEMAGAGSNLNKLTIYWAAKEAIYKAYGKKQIEFKSAIAINDFNLQNTGELNGKLLLADKTRSFKLQYQKHNEYWLVVTKHEI